MPPPVLPSPSRDPFPEQVAVVLEARPAVFSFTFGIPGPDVLARFRAPGIAILGTATSPEEARLLEDAGVDGIVAQGAEAGAHLGSFATPSDEAMVPALDHGVARPSSSRSRSDARGHSPIQSAQR
jgi:nitronate monooxygenase